jgi:hypothetical protein
MFSLTNAGTTTDCRAGIFRVAVGLQQAIRDRRGAGASLVGLVGPGWDGRPGRLVGLIGKVGLVAWSA